MSTTSGNLFALSRRSEFVKKKTVEVSWNRITSVFRYEALATDMLDEECCNITGSDINSIRHSIL